MTNPITGIYLDNKYYNFVTGSYSRSYELRSTSEEGQNTRVFSVAGKLLPKHSITLVLDNQYTVRGISGNAELGTTLNLGVSRLNELVNILGARGSSMPLVFVAFDGSSHLVVPTGSIDISEYRTPPSDTGVEYRVSLTFENSV